MGGGGGADLSGAEILVYYNINFPATTNFGNNVCNSN